VIINYQRFRLSTFVFGLAVARLIKSASYIRRLPIKGAARAPILSLSQGRLIDATLLHAAHNFYRRMTLDLGRSVLREVYPSLPANFGLKIVELLHVDIPPEVDLSVGEAWLQL
jgi:hypothetical protein